MQLCVLDGLVSNFIALFRLVRDLLDLSLAIGQTQLKRLHTVHQAEELLCIDTRSGGDGR